MPDRDRPNVVVIVADDLGWGDLGCYGAERIPTPNVDRLAAEGVRLTDCHTSSAVCTPSRYSILTGRYAWRGPLKREVLMGHGPALIEPDRPTLASVLKADGYATAAVGKWHLGLGWRWRDGSVLDAFAPGTELVAPPEVDFGADVDYTAPFAGGPTELGFDRFFGIAGSLDMPPYCFLDQDRTVGVPDRAKPEYVTSQRPGLTVDGWRDDEVDVRFTREACGWLREVADRPFLLYLTPAAPHRPCVPPEFVRGRTGLGDRADAVCLVDWMVGEVVRTLAETGVLDRTLVMVTSDNGAPTCFPEDGDVVTHRPNGPWRGQKADIWEGGHRAPFVARWPGHIPAGTRAGGAVCLTDLLPTVAAATGAPVPAGAAEDGIDLLPLLTGTGGVPADRPVVHHSWLGWFAVRYGPWKAVFGRGSGGFTDPVGTPSTADAPDGQLYDVTADPAESYDLWAERPDVVAELYRVLRDTVADPAHGLPFDLPLAVPG